MKIYGFQIFFALLKTTLQQALAKNTNGTTVIMLYVPLLNEVKS